MNKLNKDEMIKRYIYDVTRRLPQKSRSDLEEELRGNIYDMLPDDYTAQDVENVLQTLGNPAKLAAEYKDERRSLISGAYYDQYCFVLKIVLIAVAVGMVIAFIVGAIAEPLDAATNSLVSTVSLSIAEFFGSLISGLAQAFAYVTIAFFLIERYNIRIDSREWSVADLPPVPEDKALIKKSDPIGGIVFTVIVMLLFNLAPQYIAIYITTEAVEAVPLFNLEYFYAVLPLINIAFLLGIVREILRVVSGRHTLKLSITTTLFDLVAMALVLPVYFNPSIWNPTLLTDLGAAPWFTAEFAAGMQPFWSVFYIMFAAIILFAYLLDIGTTLYKGIRYGR
ncbi:hypothetical protein LJC56_00380 [Christensenellaceae bacterium OttesenSCG-928-K19]|nr:hypothetical protein [Christensenellaceae bacterium OttesenSCG-928-K19]